VYVHEVAPEIAVPKLEVVPRYHSTLVVNEPHDSLHEPLLEVRTVPTIPYPGDETKPVQEIAGSAVFVGACGIHGGGGPAITRDTPKPPKTAAAISTAAAPASQRGLRLSQKPRYARSARRFIRTP
jgi:hypothetical protein